MRLRRCWVYGPSRCVMHVRFVCGLSRFNINLWRCWVCRPSPLNDSWGASPVRAIYRPISMCSHLDVHAYTWCVCVYVRLRVCLCSHPDVHAYMCVPPAVILMSSQHNKHDVPQQPNNQAEQKTQSPKLGGGLYQTRRPFMYAWTSG